MKALFCAAAMSLAFSGIAHASGADDGNAGLQALNAGDFDRAVALFTRALNSGDLSRDDQEFALANRGRARRMKPDDADAQNDLVALLSARYPREAIPGMPRTGFWKSLGESLLQGAAAGVASGLSGDSP